MSERTVLPRWLPVALVVAAGWLVLPAREPATAAIEPPFATVLWEQRGLDALVQIGLIFAGTLGVLGLLSEKETATVRQPSTAQQESTGDEAQTVGAQPHTAVAGFERGAPVQEGAAQ